MLGRQMEASGDALGRLEEQQPFLEVDDEPKASSPAMTPSSDQISTPPMREAITYHEVEYEPSSRARFNGLPTPQLEEAWDSLWQFGSLGIPDDNLALLNKSTTERTWHHLPSEVGGGVQAYFEGFHQIHCLYTYRHEYDYNHLHDFSNTKIDILEHVEHCLEILRTKLMCDADTTPFVAYGNEKAGITIDMNVPRKCRNFESMVDWANSHITVPFSPHTG
ncbi:hypothetical protein N8I77_013671 [Diaporthe amygdali]|uniref:Uncharacterized protein n=1 Tax=Phomopsis amygdali TaxID=1214568 RepID=A0AAD9VWD5_PHOAM|nr:hypothetical protein N8I77_013671 [Diaporthe amygdali]